MSDCNGWTNRATWLVNVHIFEHITFVEDLRLIKKREENQMLFENALRRWIYGYLSIRQSNIFCNDMIGIAVNEVNWREISEHYWNDEAI